MTKEDIDFCAEQIVAQLIGYCSDKRVFVIARHAIKCGIEHAIRDSSDQELREELKRRAMARKTVNVVLRCRDCKHCGEGCCNKSSRYKTSVCFLKPKPQVGPDRYYATLHSRKACDKFEPK